MKLVRLVNDLLRVLLTLVALHGLQSVFAHVTTLPGKFDIVQMDPTVFVYYVAADFTIQLQKVVFAQNLEI